MTPPVVVVNAEGVRKALQQKANPTTRLSMMRFFKTGKGQYGEGDAFLGVKVPDQRVIAREFQALSIKDTLQLLKSPVHEHRLTALFILGRQFKKGTEETRQKIVDEYLAHTKYVNNWDLVDSSAPQILGTWLKKRDRRILTRLAKSSLLWERRIAMVSTQALIQDEEHEDAFAVAVLLLDDSHDLMHKAVGWMLREVGKHVGVSVLRDFLKLHAHKMPRTALRYAIEHLSAEERAQWLAAKSQSRMANETGRRTPPKPVAVG